MPANIANILAWLTVSKNPLARHGEHLSRTQSKSRCTLRHTMYTTNPCAKKTTASTRYWRTRLSRASPGWYMLQKWYAKRKNLQTHRAT
mmetsp:Transcript_92854/g.258229  ORF Transcript_92854/g.258229 Transcript_92854/m.258229 type:complete len:89 (+) Transcript_92854:116-382(+)